MQSRLTLLANNQPLTLTEDFSISVEMRNPMFYDMEMFSYPVVLPLYGNRHLLKNLGDRNSDVRPVDYEHTPMEIIVDGVPFASGAAVIQEGEVVGDSITLNMDESAQSFQDLIGDLKCNEVEIPEKYRDSLLIGEKIDEVNVQVTYNTDVVITYQGKKADSKMGSVGSGYKTASTFSPQALGFSYPAQCYETGTQHAAQLDETKTRTYPDNTTVNVPKVRQSYINVSEAYPSKYYCNARVCYGHHDINDDGTTSDELVKTLPDKDVEEMYEDRGKLWVLDADRPQSGICFYVLFFLDCLFESLGVSFDKSALTSIGDFRRLCFFTTKCKYDTKPLYYGSLYKASDPEVIAGLKTTEDIKLGFFQKEVTGEDNIKYLFDDVNEWLSSRGCGGKLYLENPKDKTMQQIKYYPVTYQIVEKEDPRFSVGDLKVTEVVKMVSSTPKVVTVGQDGVASITTKSTIIGAQMSASVVRMYANKDNFPGESVSSVISSLENQFGVKFHYDYRQRKVTAYLIRDIFRQQNATPRTLHADVYSMAPLSVKITGIRAGYAAESDAKEQKNNVRNNIHNYNTDYDYIDYDKVRTVTNMEYKDIIHQVYNNQLNLFVDQRTGNKYRVKINREFTSASDMEPRLYEVGAFKGVELGDCSTLNKDYIKEFISDFTPVSMVDTNYKIALSASFDEICFSESDTQPTQTGVEYEGNVIASVNENLAQNIMAAYIDEDMEHEFVAQYIKNPLSSQVADFYVTEELKLIESYDPSSTDDGNSPLQSYDWGMSIAIMRGGGADAYYDTFDYNYDGFGNAKWRTTVGQYAMTTDSVDTYGNLLGSDGESFSLKPRAWVQPEWADQPLIVNDPAIKNRGYFDTFLLDFAQLLLYGKKYRVYCLTTAAQVADIPNHWKEWWNIDGRKSIISKVLAEVTVNDGLRQVELEIYSM